MSLNSYAGISMHNVLLLKNSTYPGVVKSTTTKSFCKRTTMAYGSWNSERNNRRNVEAF